MTTDPRSRTGTTLLWFRGHQDAVADWLSGGVVSADHAPGEGWTVVRPASVPAGLGPYGDALGLTLSRPVPDGVLPVVGMTVRGGLLVVAAADGDDAELHWVVAQPGVGPHPLGDLPVCGPRHLARVAGVPDQCDAVTALVSRGRATGTDPVALGVRLAGLLGLPGAAELRRPDPLPGSRRVEPDPREVQRFVGVLSDRLAERAEEEER